MIFILDEEIKENQKEKPKKKTKNQKKAKRFEYKWIISIFIASFFITVMLSFLSNELLNGINIAAAVLALVFFIFIGALFDIIGLSIATAEEKQFHSMAARKIRSAKYAVKLIRNAEKVSSFCNDVIGDIAGIMSGATGTAIAAVLFVTDRANAVGSFLIPAGVAAVTVGIKAFGKSVAINHSGDIVNIVSKVIYFFARFKIDKKK
ncbi:MAG: Mg2+ and Co2+ transporter CorB, partial [Oscillospiraceae bacterium]|nr:Mg2+ and Co2+ transporter CorB [Oscillospiraceae bacterium]